MCRHRESLFVGRIFAFNWAVGEIRKMLSELACEVTFLVHWVQVLQKTRTKTRLFIIICLIIKPLVPKIRDTEEV